MKNFVKTSSAIIFFLALVNFTYAQVAGDYRSIQSGNWNTATNWQIYSTSLGWSTASSKPGSSRNVIIQAGHTITLDGSNSCNNLTIQNGATLNSTVDAASAFFLRVGGVAGSNATIQNDGLLGSTTSTGDGIILEAAANALSVLIKGAGTCQVARLRAVSGNTQNFTMEIDQDVNLTVVDAPAFTAYYNNSASASTDNYTFTINAGKTVKLLNTNSYFHLSSTSTAFNGGNYTYNINGTLDLTNTTVNANILPNSSNSLSNVTLNISGLVKLGSGLNLVNSAPSANNGKVVINVTNGGVIDATNTTTLNYGDNYFKLAGTGKLKRKVDNSDVVFPIGLASATEPNFVTLNNSGTQTNFTVGLSSSFTVAPTETKVVNRQWNIQPESTGALVAIKLGWGATAQAAGFNPANPVALIHYNGTSWDESIASVNGPDANNLYTAALSGISSFGAFSVQNTGTLPLKLLNFTAKLNASLANKVDLNWQTQNEVNTANFVVERSVNGKDFTEITLVKSYNTSGNHYYAYTDLNPLNGISYYRLKQIDLDGKFDYSLIKAIENYATNFVIYPNPVASIMQITHPESSIGDVIKIVNNVGTVVKVMSPVYLSNYTSINLSDLKSGVYFVCMQNNGTMLASKFIKE